MKQQISLIVFLFLFVLPITDGCVEAPNSVGSDVLPSTDSPSLQVATLVATDHEVKQFFSNTTLLNMFCVGKYQLYEAWGFLGFYGFPDTFTNISVRNAFIRLKARYHFGDSASTIAFNIHRLKKPWFGDSLSVDSLKLFANDYYDARTIITFSQTLGDSEYAYVDIPDTHMVRLWLQTTNDSLHYNYGLLFEPTNTSIIMGFSSYYATDTSAIPLLCVEYEKNGTQQTFIHHLSTSRYVASAPYSFVVTDPSLVYAQNGVSYRTLLRFDISSVPNPSIINSATLTFVLNPVHSILTRAAHDSILVSQVNVDGSLSFPWLTYSTVTTDSLGNKIYTVDIRSAVASWVRNRYPAHIVVMGYGESSTFDKFAFYGPSAPDALKPRIEVVYTQR
ncbi:MAG: hypothetical protein N3A63_03835 [Bacteroidetes bacterium]|nr:hypothetical protein [Bacteroidota bacterium]